MARISRRSFLAHSATLAVATPFLNSATWAAAAGAGERIRVAVTGVRGRGRSHIAALLAQSNVEVACICDADLEVVGNAVKSVEKASGKAPLVVQDIRKVLEDKSI